jgi:RNA polymerase sigma factor (sigma-70 family)
MTVTDIHTTPVADTVCTRHGAHRWMAYCADCTAWHLGRQIAARETGRATASVRPDPGDRRRPPARAEARPGRLTGPAHRPGLTADSPRSTGWLLPAPGSSAAPLRIAGPPRSSANGRPRERVRRRGHGSPPHGRRRRDEDPMVATLSPFTPRQGQLPSVSRLPDGTARTVESASRPQWGGPAPGPMPPVRHRTARESGWVPLGGAEHDREPTTPRADGHEPTAILVQRAAAGDELAWSAIVNRYGRLLWSVVRGFRLSDAQAADAVQTTWLRLVEHLDALRNPERLAGWLQTTARRACLETVRRAGRECPFDPWEHESGTVVEQSAERLGDPEAQVLGQERMALVRQAVGELPERHQRLLELLVASPPLSYEEIGARLGMPVGSIGPTRARLLTRLRTALAPVTCSG